MLSPIRRLTAFLGWTRHSYYLLSGFLLVVGLIAYIWWPLAQEYLSYINWRGPWWQYFDWLLVGIFLVMSFLIMAKADLRYDAVIVFVGFCGGLVIESWGTQTNLWFYYTAERPPLWIIPAWPIASLSIDRIWRGMEALGKRGNQLLAFEANARTNRTKMGEGKGEKGKGDKILYWLVFGGFYGLMLVFVAPTFTKSLTWMALLLCAFLILTPTNYRRMTLVFLAGAALGYFLERWGTTRECWTYYTRQTPPLFAVLAHGMAAVAFWRAQGVVEALLRRGVVSKGSTG